MIRKRIFDIAVSLVGIAILLPVYIVLILFQITLNRGPVFFCQQRIGRNGIIFTIYKFRTMVMEHSGNPVTVKGESRITPLGAILRKYKLDELPELWNVLRGDMSFVGPRPDMPEFYSKLQGEERLILKLRPGITGPATLKYSNEEELLAGVPDPIAYNENVIWPDKVKLNLEYYHNHSFLGDIKLILATLFGIGKSTLIGEVSNNNNGN